MRNKTIKVFAIMTSLACGTALQAATRYWNNAGGDSRWSNSANWTSSLKPISNDTVRLENNCPDEPQNIILDEDAWLSQIDCRATGNRHYTITPENDAFMRLNSIVGSSSRTVDLTINADIRVALEYLRVRAYGGTTTLNGRVFPSPGERESMYLIAHYDNPLVLGESNTFTHVMCQDNANIVVKNPHALGQGYVRATDCSVRGLLTLQTNVVVKGSLYPSSPMEIRIAETGDQDVTLEAGTTLGGWITVVPRGNNATGHLYLRFSVTTGNLQAKLWLADYSSLTFNRETGITYWGGSNYTTDQGAVSGPGSVMVEGSGTVLIAATNSYEGGTYIRKGTLTMYEPSCLPTNGTVWLSAGATLNGYNSDRNHQFASLVGAGTVIESAFTLTRSLEPGENGPGTLSFTSAAKLALGPACTTIFELDALTGVNDRVNMLHLWSNLTLDGTLRVINLGGLETGSYKLFDMIGAGRVSGEFQRIEMPRASTGTIEVNAAGDVMLHVVRQFGTLFCIR